MTARWWSLISDPSHASFPSLGITLNRDLTKTLTLLHACREECCALLLLYWLWWVEGVLCVTMLLLGFLFACVFRCDCDKPTCQTPIHPLRNEKEMAELIWTLGTSQQSWNCLLILYEAMDNCCMREHRMSNVNIRGNSCLYYKKIYMNLVMNRGIRADFHWWYIMAY